MVKILHPRKYCTHEATVFYPSLIINVTLLSYINLRHICIRVLLLSPVSASKGKTSTKNTIAALLLLTLMTLLALLTLLILSTWFTLLTRFTLLTWFTLLTGGHGG